MFKKGTVGRYAGFRRGAAVYSLNIRVFLGPPKSVNSTQIHASVFYKDVPPGLRGRKIQCL